MALIEWREEYCTGISGIDYEHEQLIDQINGIYALIDNQSNRQLVIDGLGDIYGSISAHFALEEQMMEKRGYVHYEEHKADHVKLLDDIGDIVEHFEKTIVLDNNEFKQTLNDWFQTHFATHDSKLHKHENFITHEQVDEPTMSYLIRKAKNKLLSRVKK